jgi:hypothetical protein
MNEDINIMPSYDQSVCSTCIVCSDRLFSGAGTAYTSGVHEFTLGS